MDSAEDSAADGDATGKTLREKLESRAAAREATEEPADTGQAAETGDGADTASADTAVPAAEGADTPGQKLRDRLAEASEAAAAAAAASADTEADTADVVVEESTVAEGETRRASEEFDRTVSSGTDAATAAPTGQKDEGLSTFEKALLVGLGAIAVGELLDNGDRIVSNTGDRVVVQRGDEFRVLKDDDTLLRQPGSEVRTERFSDGSTRETLIQPDGRKIVTIRAADGRVLRRVRVLEDGTQVLLFDDTETYEPVDVATLPPPATETISLRDSASDDALRAAIEAELARDFGRNFSLAQIREIRAVRELVPTIEVEAITFALGSAAIRPELAGELADLGIALRDLIDARPGEVFLVEGHTDATGSAALNLALSDRRAETVALALTEFFDVPPENLVVQGYGESALKIQTEAAEEANRRVVVRRITPLLGDRRIAKDF
ncbi:OmpA family protein [Ovoidimarina sediminis]|uniref:OmpA family protein n=1 Tax=Ovoidimarina sediminis TaxID=3079856 RepID=UPI00292F8996|nr:OmpA family protein [Rhodophyticola sp. MJ-SS7]